MIPQECLLSDCCVVSGPGGASPASLFWCPEFTGVSWTPALPQAPCVTSGKPLPFLGYHKAALRGCENKLSSPRQAPRVGGYSPLLVPGGSVCGGGGGWSPGRTS